ncbi:glutamate--cysteine ligase [Pseudonocardia sp.]|uniref:carboxylate-amine ligase n=1 Tax=Pseudonocardia sp. TaxID=60912 RepID=UPI002605B5E4|nr:glutamate--cysteine ligase [Pseudonocardia sp.]
MEPVPSVDGGPERVVAAGSRHLRQGSAPALRTLGVEEEFLLVAPADGRAVAVGGAVLRAAESRAEPGVDQITGELQREQVETGTRPCRDLDELGREVRRSRLAVRRAAGAVGAEPAPLGTSPLPVDPNVSAGARYRAMIDTFGLVGHEQLTCGCHVHVGVASAQEGVAVLDRIRPWLAPLLALSANSPFWQGADSGYASYRSQVMGRWPSAGPAERFGSAAGYRDMVRTVLGTDTVLDEGMLYFDARLSRTHPTVEVRVADICRDGDDAVLVAALVRGLVETAAREWREGREPDPVRTEVLRLAAWRAGRSGLGDLLVDPSTWRPAPPHVVVGRLLDHVTPALEDSGDLATVRELAGVALRRGTGADRQRAVRDRGGDLGAVVRDATRALP